MDNNTKYKKTHPFSMLKQLKTSVILILLTVLQQLMFNPQSLVETISSLGVSALYVIAVVSYSISLYKNNKYRLTNSGIHIKGGIIIKKKYKIPYSKIQTVAINRDLIASLFGAVKISVDTPAGSSRKCDASAYFSKKNANTIRQMIEKGILHSEFYRSKPNNILLMSIFWSNPLAGMLFIVPVINESGKIVGTEVTRNLVVNSLSPGNKFFLTYFSPVVSLVAVLLLTSWFISGMVVFQRYVKFGSYNLGDFLVVSRGLINPGTIYTRKKGICAVTEDQSLLMKILGLYSAGICVAGSGKLKGDKGLIIPPVRKKEFDEKFHALTGVGEYEDKSLWAVKGSIMSYIYLPLIFLGGITAVFVLDMVVDFERELSIVLFVLLFLIIMWWMALRIFAYKSAHIGICGDRFVACSFKNLTVKKYYIPFDKICRIELCQSVFQKKKGKCSMKIYIYYEKKMVVTVKQLPKADAEKLAAMVG